MRCPTRRSYRRRSAGKSSKKFCAKVTRRCCWTTSNCCGNSARRAWTTNLSRPPKLCARCRFFRRVRRSRNFSNRPTPRLCISTGSNTRSSSPTSRMIGRSISMPNFHARFFCAGWNEGAWPPPVGTEFARAEEIHASNRSVQQLNKRAARQGSQGEGHTSVRENHSLYLGPGEQRAIALRQFDALLESASEGVTLTASLVQEDAPERFWNPSECFTELYLKTRRGPLTQATLKNLQRATALLPRQAGIVTDVQQTLIAFNARRDSSKPAGEYDFSLRPNESYRPVRTLSVTDLRGMVSSPAIVWMKRYLGVEAPEDAANPWAATTGKWVHHWLANIIETRDGKIFSAFPTLTKIDERISFAADERCAALRCLCVLVGKVVPDWWSS